MRYASKREINANSRLMFDKRKKLRDGSYPVKVEVAYGSKKRRYVTGVKLTEDEWKQIYSPGLQDKNLKKKKDTIEKYLVKSKGVLEEMAKLKNPDEAFDFDQFAYKFTGKIPTEIEDQMDLYLHFNEYATKLRGEEKIGTAVLYENTASSLKKYKKEMKVTDVTVKFLQGYEKWMIEQGKKYSTIGMYLRNLRAIINIAKVKKLFPADMYPFGLESKGLYEIPEGDNTKKALDPKVLKLILTYKPVSELDEFYTGTWLFSFYCNGMNPSDILSLQNKKIQGDIMTFIRNKTQRTMKKKIQPVILRIPEPVRPFLAKFRNKDTSPDAYVFDVYKPGMTADERYETKKNFIKAVNQALDHMKDRLGITEKINMMASRHSWATIMMNEEAPIAYISKGLGHTSIKTTENYLGQFYDKKNEEYENKLVSFTSDLVSPAVAK